VYNGRNTWQYEWDYVKPLRSRHLRR
jgi:hypothetical protein